MDRHELDRGYPQRRKMPERRLGGEPKVGASQMFRYRLVELREASDVQLVNQRLVPRGAQRPIVTPGERCVDYGTERSERCAVAIVEGRVIRARSKTEERVVPADRTADDLRVGIHDELVGVESMTGVRRVRTVHAIAVELPGMDVGQVAVPDHVGLLGQRDGQGFDLGVDRVEEAQLHAGRVLGKNREIDPDAVPGCAEGIGSTRPDAQLVRCHS